MNLKGFKNTVKNGYLRGYEQSYYSRGGIVEEDGRRWKKMEEDGRSWKKLEEVGRKNSKKYQKHLKSVGDHLGTLVGVQRAQKNYYSDPVTTKTFTGNLTNRFARV